MKTKFVLCMLVVGLLIFSACSKAQDQPIGAGSTAPDFTLETIAGETIVLSEILKNQRVVLDFWASWCPPCVKAISELEEFYSENKDKIGVLGINVQESKAKVESFLKKKGVSYPVVLDSDGSVARLYNVRGIPTIVLVEKDGSILYYGHSVEEMTNKAGF